MNSKALILRKVTSCFRKERLRLREEFRVKEKAHQVILDSLELSSAPLPFWKKLFIWLRKLKAKKLKREILLLKQKIDQYSRAVKDVVVGKHQLAIQLLKELAVRASRALTFPTSSVGSPAFSINTALPNSAELDHLMGLRRELLSLQKTEL